MVIHKAHTSRCHPEMHGVRTSAAALVPHAQEVANRVEDVQIAEGSPPEGKAFKIVAKKPAGVRPPETHFTYLLRLGLSKFQTGLNAKPGKPRIVFEAAQSFLGHREQQLTVSHYASRRVVHLRIVDADSQHPAVQRTVSNFEPQHQLIGVLAPVISRTRPPAAPTIPAILSALIAAPRQLLPAAHGSKPKTRAVRRLAERRCMDQSRSTIPQAMRPRKFIVAANPPLN